jgi:hypothetical protein
MSRAGLVRGFALGLATMVLATMAGTIAAAAPAPRGRFANEPSVTSLQRAAAALADVQPERVQSLLRRARAAAALPGLKVRVGRGAPAYSLYKDGYVPATSEGWHFELEASWSFDRLIFDHNELGLLRETQRLAARREALLVQVTQLYFDRRRLQLAALAEPEREAEEALERALAIEELTAILDGLTGGALSKGTNGATGD